VPTSGNAALQRSFRPKPTAGRIPHDAEMYKWRHLAENFFCHLKAFRRIATRYEKTDACFAGFVNLVASFLAIR
jgi:transposase